MSTALARQKDASYEAAPAARKAAGPSAGRDGSAARGASPGGTLADRVKAQLSGDYPASALSWVDSVSWQAPVRVPLAQIDFTAGQPDWDAAAADKGKLSAFRKRMAAAGWWKPAVVLRLPGKPHLFVCDGHGRTLTSKALGLPVLAYIGTAKTAAGPWQSFHSRQV